MNSALFQDPEKKKERKDLGLMVSDDEDIDENLDIKDVDLEVKNKGEEGVQRSNGSNTIDKAK